MARNKVLGAPRGLEPAVSVQRLQPWLKQHAQASVSCKEGSSGTPSPWFDIGTLELMAGTVLLADPLYLWSGQGCLVTELQPGVYHVAIQLMAYGQDSRVAGVRAHLESGSIHGGSRIDSTSTDTATTAICDEALLGKVSDSEAKRLEKAIATFDPARFWHVLKPRGVARLKILCLSSGFGDGEYPVRALMSGKRRVGFEVEFIPATERYPYDQDSPPTIESELRRVSEMVDKLIRPDRPKPR